MTYLGQNENDHKTTTTFYCLNYISMVTGVSHRLFSSYLDDRTQKCVVNGSLSECCTLKCGIPQGTILGHYYFCYISMICPIVCLTLCQECMLTITICTYPIGLVQSHFDYCSVVWGNCGKTLRDKLQNPRTVRHAFSQTLIMMQMRVYF